VKELSMRDWRIEAVDLGNGFPYPAVDARDAACARLAALPAGHPVVIDGLAFGVLAEAATALRASHPLVALVHHPLALESGLSAADAASLCASERSALVCTRHIIATSATIARLLV